MFINSIILGLNKNIRRNSLSLFNSTIKHMSIPCCSPSRLVFAPCSSVCHPNIDADAKLIFSSAIEAVLPHKMISKHVSFFAKDNLLKVDNVSYQLQQNVYVVGFGKAVCGMASALNEILQEHIVEGILSIPHGIQQTLREAGKTSLLPSNERIALYEGAANNFPDKEAHETALKIQQLITSIKETDILFVLISGGGSALLPTPCPPITIEEETILTKLLANNGATINELNQIRQNLEILKGGGLAQMTNANRVISLILSDVIGDPIDKIASGPTVLVPPAPQQCLELFEKLKIKNHVPLSVLSVLEEKKHQNSDLRRQSKANHQNVLNVIVGSNQIATEAAFICASENGYSPIVLTTQLEGEARNVAKAFANLAKFICKKLLNPENCSLHDSLENLFPKCFLEKFTNLEDLIREADACRKPICIICGGETTVTVRGKGKGGRNQEMVLAMALCLKEEFGANLKEFRVHFLSAGTDGQDGPTDVAGCSISSEFEIEETLAKKHLEENDAYNYFHSFLNGQCFVKTGLTATNVMDIQLLIIDRLNILKVN